MTLNTANFLFKYFVPESCFKLSLTQRCRRDVHGFLTTTKKNLEETTYLQKFSMGQMANMSYIWAVGRKSSTIQWCFGGVGLDDHEVFGIMYLKVIKSKLQFSSPWKNFKSYSCSFVLTARDTVSPVLAHLEISDNIAMRPLVIVDFLARFNVEKSNLARFMTGDDNIRRQGKCANSCFWSNRVEHIQWLFRFCDSQNLIILYQQSKSKRSVERTLRAISLITNRKYSNRTLVTHTLLSNANNACSFLIEGDSFNGSGELPGV